MTNDKLSSVIINERIKSLDFFRGLTMFLLIAEFTSLFGQLTNPSLEGSWIHSIGMQFHHHPWNGLRFWDLIQPFFMFIVGVAMPFSIGNRIKRGQTKIQIRNHVFQRAFLLLFFGWALYCIGAGHIVFRFQNVLAQLSVTYLLAYLVMHKKVKFQIIFSFVLIIVTEVLYRSFWVEGFNHAFVANENFGTWLDMQYGGADLHGGWVSFNAIPTTAHTIWGVLVGQLLLSKRTGPNKLKILIIAGLIGIAAGYALDPVTPIIKRICTSSFILVSGGWSIMAMALSYWIIDLKHWEKGTFYFTIVGMNPLFIYLFAHLGGGGFINEIIQPFTTSLLGWVGELGSGVITSVIVLYLMWYLTYWLYKKRIFFKI